MSDTFNFTIEKHIATIGQSGGDGKITKELNVVSWNGKSAKYDLRAWSADHSRGYKGLSLDIGELRALKAALDGLPELAGEGETANGN